MEECDFLRLTGFPVFLLKHITKRNSWTVFRCITLNMCQDTLNACIPEQHIFKNAPETLISG